MISDDLQIGGRSSEKLSLLDTDSGAFGSFAIGIALYQLAPCVACDVFLLQLVLALSDAEKRVGGLRAVAEAVGVAAADFDDGFAVTHALLALQQQIHIAARNITAVTAVGFLQNGCRRPIIPVAVVFGRTLVKTGFV